ncbi:MAG: exodeoxyribonuclease VII small subunit [Candidatus Kapabacteria bacterium]|nr:exodeoxyribonuclease VII small subunit [Candidatus Kapabacteria bacterium]
MKTKSFESNLERLEEIIKVLDSGDVPLDSMLKSYEEGMKLINDCRGFLNSAELKIIDIKNSSAETL